MQREELLKKIEAERERQYQLPGSEFDINHNPNDWIAIVTRYLSEGAKFGGITPLREEFEDALIKAGAVLLAALEHSEHMKAEKKLK